MPHPAFAGFIPPSVLATILFIALPPASVAVPSLFVEHPQALLSVESCDPFGCKTETRVDAAALAALALEAPLGRCNGFGTYLNAAHLAWGDLEAIWATAPDAGTAHASSLSSLNVFALRGDTPLFGSAAATSLLTLACLAALLTPSLRNAWHSFRTRA